MTFINRHKVLLVVLLVLALVFIFSGCSSTETEEAPTRTETTSTSPAAGLTTQEIEDVYTNAVISEYPEFLGLEDDLVDAGHRVCDDLKAGATLEDFAADSMAEGIDAEQYGYILGAATYAFCPEYLDDLDLSENT